MPPLTAWFVTTSFTKSIPSGSGICTPRRVRSVSVNGWLSLGPPSSPHLPPTPLPPPTLPLSRGITPICSMVFRGACSGISWEEGGVESGHEEVVGLSWVLSLTPSAACPPTLTHCQGLQCRLVRVDSEPAGEKEARSLRPPRPSHQRLSFSPSCPTYTHFQGVLPVSGCESLREPFLPL